MQIEVTSEELDLILKSIRHARYGFAAWGTTASDVDRVLALRDLYLKLAEVADDGE